MTHDFAHCVNEGLRICETCKRNIDHYPELERIVPRINFLKPAADPPRCADWAAMPSKAGRDV